MVIKFLKNQRKREILLSIICGIIIIVYLKIHNILFSQPHLTSIVILVALFWQSFLSFINRPILKLSFIQNSDKCFRNGMLEDSIQEFRLQSIAHGSAGYREEVRTCMQQTEYALLTILRYRKLSGKDKKHP